MNGGKFYKCVEQFEYGRTSVTDDRHSGRAVEISAPARECHIDTLVQEDLIVELRAEELQVSGYSTVHLHS